VPIRAQGPRPLDEAAYTEAQVRGRAGDPPGNEPFVMRLRAMPDPDTLDLIEDAPFSFYIQTPWSMVSESAALAASGASPPADLPSREDANASLVSIEVSPGRIAETADAIFHVVLRRNGREIRPVTVRVVPYRVDAGNGRSLLLTAGSFRFPYEAFGPGSALTLVFVGTKSSFEWTMTPEELGQLR
jgi:hypothetical protein